MEVKNKKIKNITIFVHGTHTDILTKIFKRVLLIPNKLTKIIDLDEYSYVKWFADKMIFTDPIQFTKDDFYAIGWSGILSPKERFIGSQIIYSEITKLVSQLNAENIDFKITLIGHSHGGNVALNLAKINENPPFKINRLVLLATPVQEETENLIESDIFEQVYSIYSTADMIQVLDPQGLQNAKLSFFSNRKFKHHDKLKQAKLKINDRAIFHEEFIFHIFPKILPKLLEVMQKQICDENEHLIKIEYKKNKIVKIEVE